MAVSDADKCLTGLLQSVSVGSQTIYFCLPFFPPAALTEKTIATESGGFMPFLKQGMGCKHGSPLGEEFTF